MIPTQLIILYPFHSINFLSTDYVPGTILDVGDATVGNKKPCIPVLMSFNF